MIYFLISPVPLVFFLICLSAKSEILLQSFYERHLRLGDSFWFIIQFSHRTTVACRSIGFLGWLSTPVLTWYPLFKEDEDKNKITKWREERSVAFPVVCLRRGFPGMFATNQAFAKHALLFGCFTLRFQWDYELSRRDDRPVFWLLMVCVDLWKFLLHRKVFGWWSFASEVWLMFHSGHLRWFTKETRTKIADLVPPMLGKVKYIFVIEHFYLLFFFFYSANCYCCHNHCGSSGKHIEHFGKT